jgi:hypothetical protein
MRAAAALTALPLYCIAKKPPTIQEINSEVEAQFCG